MDIIDKSHDVDRLEIKKTSLKALERAIRIAGNVNRLGLHTGIAPQVIHKWRTGQTQFGVGPKYVLIIEEVTGVSRHHLRGDIYPKGEK